MRALLEVAKCPCCDGSGGRYDDYGNAAQCQWCYERSVAISAPGAPADLPECGCCGQTGECDADCDARQAILAAAGVEAERGERDDIAAVEAAMPGLHAMLAAPVSSRRAGRRVMKQSNVFKAFLAGRSNPPAQPDAPRCQCCGCLVTQSEHRGCLRSASPHPVASVLVEAL